MRLAPLVALVSLSWSGAAVAQDCASYPLLQQGTVQTQTSYNAKGKETGSTTTTTTRAESAGDVVTAAVHADVMDDKGKPVSTLDYSVTCEAGRVLVDMDAFLPGEQLKAYEGWTMSVEGSDLEYPATLSAGQKLPDGQVVATLTMQGATPAMPAGMTTTRLEVHLRNRTVVGPESVTTAAGTFDTWKITSDIEVVSAGMVTVRTAASVVDWYAAGVGSVQSESSRNGKLQGTTRLTALTRP